MEFLQNKLPNQLPEDGSSVWIVKPRKTVHPWWPTVVRGQVPFSFLIMCQMHLQQPLHKPSNFPKGTPTYPRMEATQKQAGMRLWQGYFDAIQASGSVCIWYCLLDFPLSWTKSSLYWLSHIVFYFCICSLNCQHTGKIFVPSLEYLYYLYYPCTPVPKDRASTEQWVSIKTHKATVPMPWDACAFPVKISSSY